MIVHMLVVRVASVVAVVPRGSLIINRFQRQNRFTSTLRVLSTTYFHKVSAGTFAGSDVIFRMGFRRKHWGWEREATDSSIGEDYRYAWAQRVRAAGDARA
jgi:hypothetical protein